MAEGHVFYPFDVPLLKDMIVTLTTVLDIMGKYGVVRMYALGSYAVENFFS
jgi:hypothetical protein